MVVWIIAVAFILLVAAPFVVVWFIALNQFHILLERTSEDKWTRKCSFPEDKEYADMYRIAEQWREDNIKAMKEVSVSSDGFKLCGEYFDFGFDRAVIIVAGRTEGCHYSCYFAPPYKKAGYNVLVIDNRSHGNSEGRFNSLGLKEYRDILQWGSMLNGMGNEKVVCHGICIGSATCLYALLDKDCPDYMAGLTADGMYTTFWDSFREHLVQDKRPIFPFIQEFFLILRMKTHVKAGSFGPVKCIDKMTKPILFIHSMEDKFSVPEKTWKMYEVCPSDNKKFEWFEKGRHSFVRYNNTEHYDRTVEEFWR